MTTTPEQAVIQAVDRNTVTAFLVEADHHLRESERYREFRHGEPTQTEKLLRDAMDIINKLDNDRLAHSQPASEGQLVYETLRELRDSAKEVMALLQRSPTMQGREHVGIGSRFANAIAAAGMMLETQPLTEPQRLGQEGERSVAEEWCAYMDEAVSKAPEPLRQLGEYLAGLLDEDQWKAAERYLNAAALTPAQAEPVAETGEGR